MRQHWLANLKPPLSILIVRANAVWLRDVEATSEAEAIAKGAAEFGQPKERLMAMRRYQSKRYTYKEIMTICVAYSTVVTV